MLKAFCKDTPSILKGALRLNSVIQNFLDMLKKFFCVTCFGIPNVIHVMPRKSSKRVSIQAAAQRHHYLFLLG